MSESRLPPVCLLAGGLGTRLGEHVRQTPKPLVPVAGRPFLHWVLELLARHGADRVVLCVGYLGEHIESAVGDARGFGLRASYAYDPPGLAGTLGAVRGAADQLGDEFLVLYGDTYLRLDYRAVVARFRAAGSPALMTVLRNAGRWDRSNVIFDGKRVVVYDKHAPTAGMDWIDYGLGVLRADALAEVPEDESDLAALYHRLAAGGRLAGYEATERFYEIGTPEALAEAEEALPRIAYS